MFLDQMALAYICYINITVHFFVSKNTDLKNRKVVWPGHFLAPLHHLPVGDLGP